jgi:hypothetical protein
VKRSLFLIGIGTLLGIILGYHAHASAQIYRIGAGLNFASGFKLNAIETGNPGITLKTWIALDKRSTIHIVPSLTAFYPNTLDISLYSLRNLMFQGDLNGQYQLFKEGTIGLVVMAGGNFTYVQETISQADPKYPIPEYAPNDSAAYAIGANVGAGLELRMAPKWDMNVSIKYIISKYSQFIISAEGVYYFKSRRRAYRGR